MTIQDVRCVNGYVVCYLAECGIRISDACACPHDSLDGCECIKPKPYFLKKAEKVYGIDLSRSFAVEDHPHPVGTTRVKLL